tara:strand:+ start:85 stop:792 length:708 start_codon:yes stop_codon:yes gene_type:complete
MKNIYISGTSSGLGKFLIKSIHNSKKFYRNKKNNIKKNSILIHSAFFKKKNNESKKNFNINKLQTLTLFKKIKKYNFESIILISTIDIYHTESSKNSYIVLKKKLETEIKKTKNFYIFRCGLLIGKQMKKNSFYKLIRAKSKTKIPLSSKSSIYLTSYKDILNGIKKIIEKKKIKNDTYNLVSKEKLYLKNFENKNIIFGNYQLNYKKINNIKFEKNFGIKTQQVNKLIKEIEKI